ncbi:MAG: hypothetical protein DA330_02125 [Nitrososphaera sp.]|nr:hypothetical protein [Nitrososphaera sp.]
MCRGFVVVLTWSQKHNPHTTAVVDRLSILIVRLIKIVKASKSDAAVNRRGLPTCLFRIDLILPRTAKDRPINRFSLDNRLISVHLMPAEHTYSNVAHRIYLLSARQKSI